MRARVRFLISETTADRFTDDDIDALINQGNLDVANRTEYLLSTATLNTTASKRTYRLPSDCLRLKFIKLANKYLAPTSHRELDLEYTREEDETWFTETGEPTHYYQEKEDVIGLFPIPDDSYTMRIWYVQKPDTLTDDTDTSILPEFCHEAVCLYAAYWCKEQDREYEAADRLWIKYMQAIKEINDKRKEREIQGPFSLVLNEDYYPVDVEDY